VFNIGGDTENGTKSDLVQTVLGDKKENPYTLANMNQAYHNIYDSTTNLETTHYYVKFIPKTYEEVTRKYDDAKNALLVAEAKLHKALPFANKAFVNIEVVTAELKGCSVPLNALFHRKDGTFIMLYKENKFQAMRVEVLIQNSKDAIIKECPTDAVATASEAKLALLPSLGEVVVTQEN